MAVKIQIVVLRFLTTCTFGGSYPYFYPQVQKAETEGGKRFFFNVFD